MKVGILLCLSLSIVSVFSKRKLPLEEWREQLEPFKSECLCESNVHSHHIDNFFTHGELAEHACFKCLLKCYATKLNILTPGGTIDIENFQQIAGVTEKIAIKCSQFNETDLCQKVYRIAECVIEELVQTESKPEPVPKQPPTFS